MVLEKRIAVYRLLQVHHLHVRRTTQYLRHPSTIIGAVIFELWPIENTSPQIQKLEKIQGTSAISVFQYRTEVISITDLNYISTDMS